MNRSSSAYRLVRSVLPSPISALSCVSFGVVIVIIYLVIQSVGIGTSLPALFEGEWGVLYTNTIVQPLATVFHDATLGKVVTIFMWGFLGLITYLIVEYSTYVFKSLRMAENNIQLTDRAIVRHPGLRSFIVAALWRIMVLIVFSIIFVVVVQPLIRNLATLAPHVVLGNLPVAESVKRLLQLAAGWALIAHIVVVFVRLFAMRVRLFSDDPY